MKCKKCGYKNDQGVDYCANCGNKFEKEKNKTKKKKKIILIISCIAVVCTVVFIVLFFTVFNKPDKNQLLQQGLTDYFEINKEVNEIESEFAEANGFVSHKNANNAINAVGKYAEKLYNNGQIKEYEITEGYSVWIKFNSGLEYVYSPAIEDTDSSNISTYQPCLSTYDNDLQKYSKECVDNSADNIQNIIDDLSFVNNYDDSDITLEVLPDMGKNKVVIWHGHGGYSKQTHSFIVTGIKLDETKFLLDPVYYIKNIEYTDEYLGGELIFTNSGHIAVGNKYFENHLQEISGSVIYLGTCSSGVDDVLAQTFLNKGATSVIANSGIICTRYNLSMIKTIFEQMLKSTGSDNHYDTLQTALEYAYDKNGEYCCESDQSHPIIFGKKEFRLTENDVTKTLNSNDFQSDKYLVEYNGTVYYVDQNGLWKNTGELESELLYDCKATNIATNGEVIYYGVYNKDTTAYCEDFGEEMTWYQFDMYSYDLRTSVNTKITSFTECGKPICAYNGKVYYTDYPDDFTGNAVGLAKSLYSLDLQSGKKEFISDKADMVETHGTNIFFRDIVVSVDLSNAQLNCYDMTNGKIKQITDDGVNDFSISGDSLFYTQFDYQTVNNSHKENCKIYKYNILDGTSEKIFDEKSNDNIFIQYVDENYIYYSKGSYSTSYSNYRIDLSSGSKTSIEYKARDSGSAKMSDGKPYSVFKIDSAALYYTNSSIYFYQANDNDSYAIPYNAFYNGSQLLNVSNDGVYVVKEGSNYYFYDIVRYYFDRNSSNVVSYG